MGENDKITNIDYSAFLDEHGMLMADKLKEYEESLKKENEKNQK